MIGAHGLAWTDDPARWQSPPRGYFRCAAAILGAVEKVMAEAWSGGRHMTAEEYEMQAMDWAYGNLAASANHKPSRAAFSELAVERGWSQEQFNTWAEGREWLP
jgi:hypothetical protein